MRKIMLLVCCFLIGFIVSFSSQKAYSGLIKWYALSKASDANEKVEELEKVVRDQDLRITRIERMVLKK